MDLKEEALVKEETSVKEDIETSVKEEVLVKEDVETPVKEEDIYVKYYVVFSLKENIIYNGNITDYWKGSDPKWINELKPDERNAYLALNRKFQDRSNGKFYVASDPIVDMFGDLCIVTNQQHKLILYKETDQ